MENINYFLVAGYGWSGSSAVVDLLKEFEDNWEPCVEFRAVKDPYGIHDLHHNLVEEWDLLNADNAIRDFRWHMMHLYHQSSRYSLISGLGYKNSVGEHFLDATDRFIKKLVDFEYESWWWFPEFKKSKLELLSTKLKRKITRSLDKEDSTMSFAKVDENYFLECAKEYLDEIFMPIAKENDAKNVILDQAVSIPNFEKQMRCFRNAKLVVVDRDPRDIYVDLIREKGLIGRELGKSHDATMYVKWHKAWRSNIERMQDNSDVFCLQFEDLVLHYEESVIKIAEFLELDMSKHIAKKQLFDPARSVKNIGIWKDGLSDSERCVLERELEAYLFENKN